MNSIYLSIAGFTIEVRFHETEVPVTEKLHKSAMQKRLREFVVVKKPSRNDFTIHMVWNLEQEIVERKKEKQYFVYLYKMRKSNAIETYYQNSYFQFQTVLRHALDILLTKNEGFMVHASASSIHGAHLFLGKSGAGKSTIMNLLSKKFRSLADDAVIVKKEGKEYVVYQTPFVEKNVILGKTPDPLPLKQICFLHKSSQGKVSKIRDKSALLQQMLEASFIMSETKKKIAMITEFVNTQDIFYSLSFAKDEKKVLELFSSMYAK